MAIQFDNRIRVSASGSAYLGDSYDAARKIGSVAFAFYFDVIAVVGEGIWLNGSTTTDPIPFPDSNPLAYLTYDLDRSFSVELTDKGRESVEHDLGSGYKLQVEYAMIYLADSPNVPAFAFGPNAFESVPPGAYALREGYMTEAAGNQSHAEGYSTNASGNAAHSEGRETDASGDWSHAEGYGTEAINAYAHAEGYGAVASSTAAHAEGYDTFARGQYAHAEGYEAIASSTAAHAEGWRTAASKAYSHAQNRGTKASSEAQTALGKYNVEDANGQYAAIIGNGTSDTDRSNALTVEWDGSVNCGTVNGVDLNELPLIQRGTISPAAHAASSTDTSAITFTDEFSASPTVIVGIRGQTQTEGIGRCSAWASNVSATGFTLNFRNDFTAARTFGAYWIAVGGGTAGGGGGGGDTSALEQRMAELEAEMQALAESTAYVGANHIAIDGTTVSDTLTPITSGTIDDMEV